MIQPTGTNEVVLNGGATVVRTGGTAIGIANALNKEVVRFEGREYKVKVKEFIFLVEFPDLYDHALINSIAPVHSFIQIEGE